MRTQNLATTIAPAARSTYLSKLNEVVASEWKRAKEQSKFFKLVMNETLEMRLYANYMVQTYHYTKHNAKNQALVGALAKDVSPGYLKFCFHHAAEEAGHEMMAVKDLQSIGIAPSESMSSEMLMETEALVAYLYWISATGNPLQRLGYSFWAENSYHYIQDILGKVKSDLNLQPRQMTFFVAHSDIDAEHAAEVERELLLNCRTEQDWRDVETVMVRSLRLTVAMMDAVATQYTEQN